MNEIELLTSGDIARELGESQHVINYRIQRLIEAKQLHVAGRVAGVRVFQPEALEVVRQSLQGTMSPPESPPELSPELSPENPKADTSTTAAA